MTEQILQYDTPNNKDLAERVLKFNSLELPGQPMMMHMGTSYLVNDLWAEVKLLMAIQAQDKEDGDD